jgi:hypothetical protein
MDTEELKKTVKKAEKEVKVLLKEVQASKPDRTKLDTGLKEVQSDLRILGVHIGRDDDDDDDEHDPK